MRHDSSLSRALLPACVLVGLILTSAPASAQPAWQAGPAMAAARSSFSMTPLADGRLLVAGGWSSGAAMRSCEIFDPATRSWSPTGDLDVARMRHVAVRLHDGRVLVMGGETGSVGLRSAEVFNPATGGWTRTPDMAYGTGIPDGLDAVVLQDGRVFAHASQGSAELYDPARNTWSLTSFFPAWRMLGSVTLLKDGRVLLAGGLTDGPATTAAIWTPSTNSWQETGPVLVPRDGHTATLLADGRVLMVGGWWWETIPGRGSSSVGTIEEAELFDPATLTWSAAGTLATSRSYHSTTLLPSGKVLVAGGKPFDDTGNPLPAVDSVELYDPATNSWSAGPTLLSPGLRLRAAVLSRGEPLVTSGGSVEILEPPIWHSWFAVDTLETPYVGDFDGDGKTDIITFTRQNPSAVGDVYVALSDGTAFGANTKWHDWFAITTDEQVVIGDYDGDGSDDIATWLGTTTRQAYVALSTGTGMTPETVWASSIGSDPTDVLLSGDANGDDKDDLICFARKQGKVLVALSTGSSFAAPAEWHGWFAVSTSERPRVADVNGDGKADIVTFATDSPTAQGDVYVAISDGTKFTSSAGVPNNSTKWHDWFAVQPGEQVRIGNRDGDTMEDFFTFLPAPFAQCYSVRSEGTQMGPNVLWPEPVAPISTDVPYVGDANGDGKADVIVFAQREGRVYVSPGR